MKFLPLLFLALATAALGQITDVAGQNELYEFIQKAEEVTLYSLDPSPPESHPADKTPGAPEKLHGYVVYGKIAGSPEALRERIRSNVIAGVITPQEAYACFYPRLAVSLVWKGKRLDILLAYQCHQSRFYFEDEWDDGPLGDSGEAELNALIDAHKIKRDVPKPHAPPEQK